LYGYNERDFMKVGKKILSALVFLLLVVGTDVSCTKEYHQHPTTTKQKRHGPPPHAPAHGYRAKTSEGIAIVYDSRLRVYVVIDISNHYYYNGFYYRLNEDRWEGCAHIHGSWQPVAENKVPPGLRSGAKKKKGKKKGKKH
jgi:hypothetical protein